MLESFKGKRIYSILNTKCARCHEGEFFISKKTYRLKELGKTHENCSVCGLKYEREPGFFYGAMYVSYALSVAFSVAIAVAIVVLYPSASYIVYIVAILSGLVLLMPFSYRMSRIVWLNLFEHFRTPEQLKSRVKK